MVGIVLAACGGDEATAESFHPSEDAVEIGTTGVYLRDGERVDEAPSPTTTPNAPVITSASAKQTGTNEFELKLEVEHEPGATIAWAFLDFGEHGVYRTHVHAPSAVAPAGGGSGDYAKTCREMMAKQNISCTDACISACACVTCGDSTVLNNLKLACATTCSANVSSGAIDSAPYDGSEAKLADVVYNGSPDVGLQGTATAAGCNASACGDGAGDDDTGRTKPYAITFEAPSVPELTPLVAPQVQTDDTPITSEPFGEARVSVCRQGNAVPCR